jgi:DNA-binding GntR family transcriptional regulator
VSTVYSMQTVAIRRDNLSGAVAERLRGMVVDGVLRPGERLNEVQLSRRLGVSRTPLREALAGLAAEGALDAVPRIGYFVRPLTVEEFEQIYPMRAILDPAALKLAGVPAERTITKLKRMNGKIEAERDPVRAIDLDDAWHRELVRGCPNGVLTGLIGQFMRRTRRYELALMREQEGVAQAATGHDAILSALAAGDLDAACGALRDNLSQGTGAIVQWLRTRAPAEKQDRGESE